MASFFEVFGFHGDYLLTALHVLSSGRYAPIYNTIDTTLYDPYTSDGNSTKATEWIANNIDRSRKDASSWSPRRYQ